MDAAITPALQDFVKKHAASHQSPRVASFADKLPRTQTGKLQRFKLREYPPLP